MYTYSINFSGHHTKPYAHIYISFRVETATWNLLRYHIACRPINMCNIHNINSRWSWNFKHTKGLIYFVDWKIFVPPQKSNADSILAFSAILLIKTRSFVSVISIVASLVLWTGTTIKSINLVLVNKARNSKNISFGKHLFYAMAPQLISQDLFTENKWSAGGQLSNCVPSRYHTVLIFTRLGPRSVWWEYYLLSKVPDAYHVTSIL